jgi:hypothetical protein
MLRVYFHLPDDVGNFIRAIALGSLVKKSPQPLVMRHASRFAPRARGLQSFLDSLHGHVVDVPTLGKNVKGSAVRMVEQVGNMAVRLPK